MSKAKFTYDESGATFFYFVLSFLALLLVPATYQLWPYEAETNELRDPCNCNQCQTKRQYLNNQNKRKRSKKTLIRAVIVIGWILFTIVAYRCATTQNEYANWDPFEILGLPSDASEAEIKKAYRKLSLIHHPDKGSSDPSKFVDISKAYAALTDEEARNNWEKYGNPDGPTFASYGIALPSWIVEKENSFVVLGIYALIFMVALPVSVGAWWYRSMKFGTENVLFKTSEIYFYYIHWTPNMPLKRVITILGASLEFAKPFNPEIIERPTDNQEVPRLIREIPLVGIDKENMEENKPLNYSYSIKARAILHAHLGRMKLPPTTLEVDRCYMIKKCPLLLQEFVRVTSQLITLALAGRATNTPSLMTLENAMKLSPLIIQALLEYQSPLLQLPHFSNDTMKHIERRKVKIRSIEQLARMKEAERRSLLKFFNDSQYNDIKNVMGNMPMVKVDCKLEVLDDEEPNVITAQSIVTAIVKLKRTTLRDLFEKGEEEINAAGKTEEQQENTTSDEQNQNTNEPEPDGSNDENKNPGNVVKNRGKKAPKKDTNESDVSKSKSTSTDDEDEAWEKKFQEKIIKKQKVLESKPKISHTVHCPYFPDDKQEFWWVYIVDRKHFALITAPLLVTNLKDTEEVELKFSAPRVGFRTYTIVVRSDSYVDCTVSKQIGFDVKPAREYVEVEYDDPEEDIEEDIVEEHSSVEDSDLLTDTDE